MPVFIQDRSDGAPFNKDDRIFLGEGLFETLRVVGGKPCYPGLHWQRLQKSAVFLEIPFDLSNELWLEKISQHLKLKKLQNGGVKAILSGGRAGRGLLERGDGSHLIFDAFEYPLQKEPLALVTAPWLRDARNPVYQIKSVNCLEAIIARRHARAVGADDALFFNWDCHAGDTTTASLFVIKNRELATPPLHSGVLPGITRHRLLSLCRAEGINCVELELHQETVAGADAVFTCNVLQGIRPVCSLDGHQFNAAHPLIKRLQDLLSRDFTG